FFFSSRVRSHRDLHSFPTRRSSDLAESYPAEDRERFLAGLADVDARARRTCGRAFLQCATTDQRALLVHLDREAFATMPGPGERSEEHTSELQSRGHLVCRLLLEKK